MNILFTEGSLVVRSLGWTLLHSLWQGALISICLWIVLKILSHSHARFRYHVSVGAMLLLAGAFISTWIRQWQRLQSITVWVTEHGKDSDVQAMHTIAVQPAQQGADVWLAHSFPGMEHVFPGLVAAYSVGILLMLIRFTAGFNRIYQLRNHNISLPDAEMQYRFQRMKERLHIHTTVKLLMSSAVQVPMVSGFFRPIILLPVSINTGLSISQLEAILLHELSHIKRQDYLVNILQIIIETMLFFNPFLWWISAGIRREREHCCDDLVLAETLQPLPYASALAALEANRYASPMPALAATGHKHQLFNRIKRMTEMKRIPLSYGRLAAAIVTVCAVTGAVIWFTPAFAQDRKEKLPTTKTKTTSVQKVIIIDDQGNKKEYNSLDDLPKEARESIEVTGMSKNDHDLDHLDEQLAGLDTMSGEKIKVIVSDAMKSVDWKDIDKTTRMALAQSDDAMKMADRELKKVDWDKINSEIDKAMKEVDRVDWNAVASASNNGKTGREMRLEIHRQIEDAREQAEDALKNAHEAQEEAHRAARRRHEAIPEPPIPPAAPHSAMSPVPPAPPAPTAYNKMLSEMDRDGLIDQDGTFEVSKNSQDLYINGEAQPDEVKVKYRHYFSPGKVHIKGSKNRLSISSAN